MNLNNKNKIYNKKCLGPIADLEKHLPVDWWRSIFNSIYLKTDADVVENTNATINEIDIFLKITQTKHSDYILDLCCGQGRHSLELAKRGYQFITGIDRSRYLIRLARGRAQKLNYRNKFSEGDARKIRIPDQSMNRVVVMGNSFGYFEQEDDDLKVLKEANRVLQEGGVLYLDVTDGSWMKENFEKRSWEWIDEELMVCRERHLASDQCRLISRELVTHAEKGVIADQFYAERLYTFEELKSQLILAGFEKIERHENVKGESFRDQDLGMMANRFLVTAVAPKKIKPKINRNQSKVICTVLMGDPRLPDSVKRNGQFNKEDFDTVNRMKEALEKLDSFLFTYFDDHKNLIKKFTINPPPFVMNLCDEGWNNDPFMELHPPALMEMLGINYTGAGPECLSLCYNKSITRAIAQDMDINIPSEIWIDPSNHSAAIPSVFPAIVKPAFGDSSIGITKDAVVNSAEELVTYFDKIKSEMPGVPILIQEFLEGREFSVGIIGNGASMEVLPLLEVDFSKLPKNLPKILGYESKWYPDSPYWTQIRYHQANLDEATTRYLFDTSMNLFQRLKCRDYARIDFRMNLRGEVKLLEVNPNPGWCWDGKMALMAEFAGIAYHELLEKVLVSALERNG
ncbi:methyltransferase domain-containing protein [Chlamydiales bacterium]|nr:methyltransferase domain-containing protein [Chlamydiales bacterium]